MLAVNHQNELWEPNVEVRGRTEGAEGVGNPIGRPTVSTWTPENSHRLSYQPMSIPMLVQGPGYIYGKALPCLALVGQDVPSPVEC